MTPFALIFLLSLEISKLAFELSMAIITIPLLPMIEFYNTEHAFVNRKFTENYQIF